MSISSDAKSGFDALYAEHQGWLQRWLRGKLGDPVEAADLAQDTFMRILVSRGLIQPLGDRPRAILTHIAKGLLADHWRSKTIERAWADAVMHLPPDLVPSPEEQLILTEALIGIDAMLRELPAFTRDVFLLAQLDGLTLQQIADRTASPVITVRRHIRKALLACMALA